MSKSLVLMLLATAAATTFTQDAQARWRRWHHNNCGCAQGSWAMNNGTAQVVSPGPTVAQSTPAPGYQSFSYEPDATAAATGTSAAPAVSYAPVYATPRSSSSEFNSVIRGDRKVRGHTAQGE